MLSAIAFLLLGLATAPGTQAHVYWANYGGTTIGRANLDGTGVNQSFITGADSPSSVAVDGAHIYWGNYQSNTIGRSNLDGTGVNQSFIIANSPTSVVVDGAHIYWTNSGTAIGRANLDGTGVNAGFITGASNVRGMAVDGAHIYWANYGSNAIGRANLDGTAKDQGFMTGLNGPYGVAVDGAHLYWPSFGGNTIGRANLDGTGANEGFINSGPLQAIAVDGAHIYWTNYVANAIARANLDSTGANPSFISGANDPYGVLVTPLETTITASPSGTVASASASFSFFGSEPGGFECRLDGASFADCSSPAAYAGLANGAHSFEVRATDAAGNVDLTPAKRSWSVDVTPAALTEYGLSRLTFAAASRGDSVVAVKRRKRPKVGTHVRYTLSEPATVVFAVERAVKGRKVRGRCRKPTSKNRRAKRCTRYVKLQAGFTHAGVRGRNRFKFTGRLSGRRLRPARYRLVATAHDAVGNDSQPKGVKFRLARR